MAIPKVKIVFDRRKTATNKRKGSLDVEINYDKKQKFFATGIMLYPKEWNDRDKCVKGENAVQLNEDLDSIINRCKEILRGMMESGVTDLNAVPRILKGKTETKTFIQFIRERIDNRNVGSATKAGYESWFRKFKTFGKIVTFSDITVPNILAYDEFLHKFKKSDDLELMQSTISSEHASLRLFIEDAVLYEHIEFNPYKTGKIKIPKRDKDHTDFLTAEKVKAIESLNLLGYMDKVRNMFLLQCYTGMAFSDLVSFDSANVMETEWGRAYISNRKKNNNKYAILLSKKAVAILEKYNWVVPRISNQNYNLKLKVIGELIGEPLLHSHQGRGTFATLALNKGIDISILQRMLGHKKISTTQHYATMLDDTVLKQMAKVMK